MKIRLAALLTLVAVLAVSPCAADWPQFRGPDRSGRSADPAGLADWTGGVPRELWRVPLGDGFSGIAVAGGRLFTQFATEDSEVLAAFSAADGREIWRIRLGGRFVESWGDGPRSTPTVTADAVVAVGSEGLLVAVNAADGGLRWQRQLVDPEDQPPDFGYSPSPLVVGDTVVVEAASGALGLVVALDLATGDEVWSFGAGRVGYSSPIAINVFERLQLVFLTRTEAIGLSVDGRLLWRWPFSGGSPIDLPITSPVFLPPDRVYVSHRADCGAVLLRLEKKAPGFVTGSVWESPFFATQLGSAVVDDGTLYGFHNATLKAVDAGTGGQLWARRGLGKGTVTLVGGRLLVLTDRGELMQVVPSREAYEERGRIRVFAGKTWTAPSYSGGRLYLRDQNEMVCLDLTSSVGAAR